MILPDVAGAVCEKLRAAFPEMAAVYRGRPAQDRQYPCLCVEQESLEAKRALRPMWMLTYAVRVHALVPEEEPNAQEILAALPARLAHALRTICADAVCVSGREMHSEVVEGVLQFSVRYAFRARLGGEEPAAMSEVAIIKEVK